MTDERRHDGHGGDSTAPYRLTADEVLDRVAGDRSGLDADEVRRRQHEHGPNRLREQEAVSAWRVLLDQFTSPLIYVLLGALVVTLAIGNYADAIVVAIVLVLNASIGFVQEYRAQTAVQSLMEMVSPTAHVRRGGRDREIDAEEVVPGDIVVLRQGGVVPADTRLLESRGLRIDESALTGESVPADKELDAIDEPNLPPADQRNMAFMGTAVTSGEGEGVVVATGLGSEMGRISEQVGEARTTETPLEMRIDRLARWITAAILGVAAAAFGVGLLLGRAVTEMLLLAVALAVSAIPEGLPVVVTVALAIGVNRMARRHVLIRKLAAVDTLGSCSTIISDKTGTLTQNRMTVRSVIGGFERFDLDHGRDGGDDDRRLRRDGQKVEVDDLPPLRDTLLAGLLCNDATPAGDGGGDGQHLPEPSGDPMEVALVDAARRAGMDRAELTRRYPERDRVPFRTEQRFMATVHDVPRDEDDGPLVLVKGAPERVVEMCDRRRTSDGGDDPLDGDAAVEASEALAGEGLRVLAMAVGRGDRAARTVQGEDPTGLVLVGMQGLVDPPRPTAVGAVDRCHEAGIRVIMVTGDHATTAAAIGRQVHVDRSPGRTAIDGAGTTVADTHGDGGIDGDGREAPTVRTGREIADMPDERLDEVLGRVNVFARVAPGQKLRIVERLRASDEIVAVTGDGVNDAPALQSAHLGAAMGSGTDVAKEASEMVITDDDFASVYAAVEEGRTAFRNIRMATFFLLSTGAAEVLLIVTALALDWPLPLLPAQILWLNVVTNGIADVALAFEPGERALFRRPPRPKSEGVLDRRLLERLVVVGLWLAAGTFAVFYWQWDVRDEGLALARTAALTTLVLFQAVHVFNSRSQDVSVFRKSPLGNRVLLLGVLASLGVHIAAMYLPWTQDLLRLEPLPAATWAVAIGVGLTAIVVNEAHKRLRPRQLTTVGGEPLGAE
ncbi:MAG TPA: HAD-IC family P-type ATPase [Acidimicrobiales bacterium]